MVNRNLTQEELKALTMNKLRGQNPGITRIVKPNVETPGSSGSRRFSVPKATGRITRGIRQAFSSPRSRKIARLRKVGKNIIVLDNLDRQLFGLNRKKTIEATGGIFFK